MLNITLFDTNWEVDSGLVVAARPDRAVVVSIPPTVVYAIQTLLRNNKDIANRECVYCASLYTVIKAPMWCGELYDAISKRNRYRGSGQQVITVSSNSVLYVLEEETMQSRLIYDITKYFTKK